MSAPLMITAATAPWAGAALADWLGAYSGTFLVLAAVNAGGVVLALGSAPHGARSAGGSPAH
jgi:hypothetical protein